MRRFAPLLLIVLSVSACGPSADEVAAQYKSRVSPKLQQLRDCARKAKAFTGAVPPLQMEGKLAFIGSEKPDATLLHVEALDEPEGKPALDLIIEHFWLDVVKSAVNGDSLGSAQAAYMENLLSGALDLKYVAFVVTRQYAEPVASSGKSFVPGYWEADLLVYSLDKGDLLGGWSLKATNSETVDAKAKDPQKFLHSDLFSSSRKAVHDALKPRCVGDNVPLG
ncbi:MAG: hypothetical protein HUU03_09110 [Planctomycetaceae bacterium]|nr:hypothetical protein [Planctomycetota bacterium]NUO16584.1 hypothetical protein [Planctomycetaceae bacterium]HRJ77127.1 hypothetical protein [Planctomycetota bacterium]